MNRRKIRMRQMMRDFLQSRGTDPNTFSNYAKLKAAALERLGIAIENTPAPAKFRALLTANMPDGARAISPARKADPSFYDSDEWRRLRYRALKLHGGCCQCCGARPATAGPLHVDHVKPRSKFPELELELSNLQVLCADCNLGKGGWDQTDWRTAEARA